MGWVAGIGKGIPGKKKKTQVPEITISKCQELPHLIRGSPSIISSSDPHNLPVQGEREAAPVGVHRARGHVLEMGAPCVSAPCKM